VSTPNSRQLALDAALTAAVLAFSVAQMASQAFGSEAGEARGADIVGVAVCLLAALPLLAPYRKLREFPARAAGRPPRRLPLPT